jgi:hypothetical protein
LFQEKNDHIGISQLIHKMNQICQIRLHHGTDFLPTGIFLWIKASSDESNKKEYNEKEECQCCYTQLHSTQ